MSDLLTDAQIQWRSRRVMPTRLSSAQLRRLGRAVTEIAVLSARTTNATYLAEIARVLDDMLAGKIGKGEARFRLLRKLKELGYDPETGFPDDVEAVPPAERGSLQDLSSEARLNLILETNERMAVGYGMMVAGNDDFARYAYPAWELVRRYPRQVPRGYTERRGALSLVPAESWPTRWEQAGGTFYRGRMIARKDSEVWQALGDGAGGHRDALGNPFPPYAFGSGMGWKAVDRDQCLRLGIIAEEETPKETRAELTPTDEAKVQETLPNVPDDLRAELLEELDVSIAERRARLQKSLEEHAAQQEGSDRAEKMREARKRGEKFIEELMK